MAHKTPDNETLKSMLPDIQKEFEILSSKSFENYEEKLREATSRAIGALQGIIDDGTLALDPEQLVQAVKTLTKANVDIVDSKRRLMETLIKGEVMMKALEPPKDMNNNSVFQEYIERQKKLQIGANANSIFNDIDNSVKEDS